MIPLPEPVKLRREIRRDGGYNMVPAYTAEQLHAYAEACVIAATTECAAACVAEERERCARICEHAWDIDGSTTAKEFADRLREGGDA